MARLKIDYSTYCWFFQGKKNKTSWKIPINAITAVADRYFQRGLRAGNVKVGVETAVKFKIFRWKTKLHRIGCEAYLTTMKISPNGSLSGGNDIKLHKILKSGSRV
ncbi:Hypothetical predicted protein [Olea europaea subsp. europaea]|uniref:Uncharacterized protein n=1 Tax=Olea europaea subsp. europaea TaxID=158383 RepID=A0A8S0SYW5_OLEEU|nr:Hypothetical predicted protein [Olea europaea subsp. europaea]